MRDMPPLTQGRPGSGSLRVRKTPRRATDELEFFLRRQAFCDEKAVCRYAQRRVVVKAAPAASLEMPQAEFLLELLVIAFNTPAQFCESHEFLDWRISWQRTEEVLGRLNFCLGPLDKQPLLRVGLAWAHCTGGAMH